MCVNMVAARVFWISPQCSDEQCNFIVRNVEGLWLCVCCIIGENGSGLATLSKKTCAVLPIWWNFCCTFTDVVMCSMLSPCIFYGSNLYFWNFVLAWLFCSNSVCPTVTWLVLFDYVFCCLNMSWVLLMLTWGILKWHGLGLDDWYISLCYHAYAIWN